MKCSVKLLRFIMFGLGILGMIDILGILGILDILGILGIIDIL